MSSAWKRTRLSSQEVQSQAAELVMRSVTPCSRNVSSMTIGEHSPERPSEVSCLNA